MSEPEEQPWPPVEHWTDEEHNHGYTVVTRGGEEPVGLVEWHREGDGWHGGHVGLDTDPEIGTKPRWRVVAGDLRDGTATLAPSILCRACGEHGFLRDGKWVPA